MPSIRPVESVEALCVSQLPPALVERFGKYRLLRVIGRGGMAEVWEADEDGVNRRVAIKRILPRLLTDSATVDMFLWESALVARLRHPNIVHTHEVGHVGNKPFISMELLEGLTMSSLLRGTKAAPPVPFAVFVVRELAKALDYLHKLGDNRGWPLGLVHRDVSLSNVIILRDGAVKLLDFGVAKSFKGLAREITPHGVLKGKFAYMAPERFGKGGYDGRVDVFAAGVILHELLTHRRLFKGRDDFHTVALVEGATVPKPSTLNPEVPPEVDRIVLRALERSADDRYRGADELLLDLDRVLDGYSWRIADAAALVCATSPVAGGGETTPATLSGQPTALRVELAPQPLPVELEVAPLPETEGGELTMKNTIAVEFAPTVAVMRKPRAGAIGLAMAASVLLVGTIIALFASPALRRAVPPPALLAPAAVVPEPTVATPAAGSPPAGAPSPDSQQILGTSATGAPPTIGSEAGAATPGTMAPGGAQPGATPPGAAQPGAPGTSPVGTQVAGSPGAPSMGAQAAGAPRAVGAPGAAPLPTVTTIPPPATPGAADVPPLEPAHAARLPAPKRAGRGGAADRAADLLPDDPPPRTAAAAEADDEDGVDEAAAPVRVPRTTTRPALRGAARPSGRRGENDPIDGSGLFNPYRTP